MTSGPNEYRKENRPPRGLMCPLVTPLKGADRLDEAALERLIEHAGRGSDALLLGDLIWGEGLVLGRNVRLALYYTALEIVQGRWPLLITVTAENNDDSRDFLARVDAFAERMAYPGRLYWFDYPLYYHSNRGLPQWYQSLEETTKYRFVIGNDAVLIGKRKIAIKHKNIRTSVLRKLTAVEAIAGMVFTGSLKRSLNYQRAVRGRRDFRIYDGDELGFIRQPSADGVMAGGANLVSRAWNDITRSSLNGCDVQQKHSGRTNELLATASMLQGLHAVYGRNPAGIMKRMLHAIGVLPHSGTASGSVPSSAQQNRSVETVLATYSLL